VGGGHVARTRDRRVVYIILVGKPERNRPLGRWEDNKVALQEVGSGGMDWIELVQVRDR
jgi:hypothetical protein